MSLQKGFLGRRFSYVDLTLTKYQTTSYGCVWILGALSIYLLFINIIEGLRYLGSTSIFDSPLFLSTSERFFYNFFYACLACFFSFSLVVSHIIKRPSIFRDIKSYKKKTILNNLSGFQNYFIYWFVKMGALIAFFNFCMPLFSYIDFFKEYQYLFIFILLVLYLQYWITLRLVFRNSILKVMGICSLLIVGVSLLFTQLPFTNDDKVDAEIRKLMVSSYIRQNLPIATYPQKAERKFLVSELFLGQSVIDSPRIHLMVKNYENIKIIRIDFTDIGNYIEIQRELLPEYERDQLTWALYIDKNVPFEDYKKLHFELRKNGVRRIISVSNKSYQEGIFQGLPPLYLDDEGQPSYELYPIGDFKPQFLEFHISIDSVFLSGQKISLDHLKSEVKAFMKKSSQENVVAITIDDEVPYGFYFQVKDRIWSAFEELRDEEAIQQSGKRFRELDEYNEPERKIRNEIRSKTPFNFLEAIDEDQKNELVRHSKH
jgi:hypothetical protein